MQRHTTVFVAVVMLIGAGAIAAGTEVNNVPVSEPVNHAAGTSAPATADENDTIKTGSFALIDAPDAGSLGVNDGFKFEVLTMFQVTDPNDRATQAQLEAIESTLRANETAPERLHDRFEDNAQLTLEIVSVNPDVGHAWLTVSADTDGPGTVLSVNLDKDRVGITNGTAVNGSVALSLSPEDLTVDQPSDDGDSVNNTTGTSAPVATDDNGIIGAGDTLDFSDAVVVEKNNSLEILTWLQVTDPSDRATQAQLETIKSILAANETAREQLRGRFEGYADLSLEVVSVDTDAGHALVDVSANADGPETVLSVDLDKERVRITDGK